MMKKLCAVLLTLAVLCGAPAAHALETEDLIPSSMALTLVVNHEITAATVGFIAAMTPDTTYVLTEPLPFVEGEAPYLCFKMLFDDSGDLISDNLIQSEVVWMNSGLTLALVAVETTEDVTAAHRGFPALAPMSSVRNGETLHRIGLNITEDNANWSTLGLFSGRTSGKAVLSSDDLPGLFPVDSPLRPGSNDKLLYLGGPVIDEEGTAVGLSTFVLDDELGNELVSALDEVIDYLDSQDIPYATRGFCGEVKDGRPTIVSTSEGGQEAGPTGSPERAGSSGSSGGGLVKDALSGGAIGLVSAGAAGAFLWLKRRKAPEQKNQKTTGAFPDSSGPSPGGGAPVLLGTGGQMDGCRFPLQGANLSFGRDPSRCAVIYDSNAPGVSALHCQLILQGETWCLIDLESSYGTYLNGRRLEPFTTNPLRPGDTFWLGQPQNSFTLKEE